MPVYFIVTFTERGQDKESVCYLGSDAEAAQGTAARVKELGFPGRAVVRRRVYSENDARVVWHRIGLKDASGSLQPPAEFIRYYQPGDPRKLRGAVMDSEEVARVEVKTKTPVPEDGTMVPLRITVAGQHFVIYGLQKARKEVKHGSWHGWAGNVEVVIGHQKSYLFTGIWDESLAIYTITVTKKCHAGNPEIRKWLLEVIGITHLEG